MALAIFDLDNTLLAGDSDYLWGEFLCEKGIVDGDEYDNKNREFYAAYQQGTMNIFEFLEFALKPLSLHPMEQLQAWHKEYMDEKISPLIRETALALVDKHRQNGDTLLVITATNSFVTAPIVKQFGIDNLIATEPEIVDGAYTGAVAGTPSFQHGKVERL
ncbi:phosphoserine phosphatase, partial [Solemya velum gill symbiont]